MKHLQTYESYNEKKIKANLNHLHQLVDELENPVIFKDEWRIKTLQKMMYDHINDLKNDLCPDLEFNRDPDSPIVHKKEADKFNLL